MAFINSLPWALFLQTLDFYEKLANIFNKVVCLACMPSDSTPPSPLKTQGPFPSIGHPILYKWRCPLKNELLPTPLKNVAPSWEMIPKKKSKYILKTTIYLHYVAAPWPAYCVITVSRGKPHSTNVNHYFYQLSSLRSPSWDLPIYSHVLTKASY